MSMKKGLDALQLVFMMFILIVVTLVIIRLFTGIVSKDTLPDIKSFQQTYKYTQEKNRCGNLCSSYTDSCSDIRAAVSYCREKVYVDINGDGRTGERKAYGIVAGEPFCEDGLYCFHIYQCKCGESAVELDATECLSVMKDYYLERTGDEATANNVVCKAVTPGECQKDPRLWKKKLSGFEPTKIEFGKYAGQIWGADYWWKMAGYVDICGEETSTSTTAVASGPKLSCSNPSGTKDIVCTWSGCTSTDDVIVTVKKGSDSNICNFDKSATGDCTVNNLASGSWQAILLCGNFEPVIKTVNII